MSRLSMLEKDSSGCISELQLDRYFGKELSAPERIALNEHLRGCVRCTLRHDSLLAQRQGFLARAPRWDALHAAKRPSGRKPASAPARWPWIAGVSATFAAAAAVLLLLAPQISPSGQLLERYKGRPAISLYVKRGERVARASSGDTFAPGDLLRVAYTSVHPVYLALFQRDANHVAIQFADGGGHKTALVKAGRDVALDFSIQLDTQPGSEQLLALFCDRPTDLQAVRESLQRARALPTVMHCQLDEFVLNKRMSPP